jgi:Cu+-exporting ATPase
MNKTNIAAFTAAVMFFLAAANTRFGDSAHAIGVIKANGGSARHASHLDAGKDGYTLIATATVIPPYRGDARITLEGEPKLDYKLYSSGPVLDLGIRRHPVFRDDTLSDLQPKDRIAVWAVIKPPAVDPVCGMAVKADFLREEHGGKNYRFCSGNCLNEFRLNPDKYKNSSARGKYTLAFTDRATGKHVLDIPVIIGEREGAGDGRHQH